MKLVRPEPLFRLAAAIALIAAPLGSAIAENKPAPAPAPISAEPQNTSAAYADWTVRCQRSADGAQRVCQLEQSLQANPQQGQPTTIAQIVVGRVNAKDPYKLIVTVVPSVSFPSSLKVSVDEKDAQPLDLPWLRCTAGGCIATADLKEDDLKRWRSQSGRGQLQFKDATGQMQTWPFSFRGFAQAMDGLGKS
jgi:invasion protein IalB